MEQAAASTLTGLFAQLGVAGIILAVLVAGAFWYLRASKDLRAEKRDVITILEARVEARDATIAARDEKITELTRQLLECQFSNANGGVSDDQS